MKRRIVKLVGLMTVLMAPLLLYAFWPYWHPMWWRDRFPPDDISVVRTAMAQQLGVTDEMIEEFELIAWANYPKFEHRLYIAYVASRSGETTTRSMFMFGFDATAWIVSGEPVDPDDPGAALFQSPMGKVLSEGDWNISPHSWKHVTGEILNPTSLNELEHPSP